MADIDIYREPTVFVLGAGASNLYGLPLGTQLKQDILELPDSQVKAFLGDQQNEAELIPDFKATLAQGDYGTIDYFLEKKKRYRELGAFYIVCVIGAHEKPESLFPQRDLYADLFHMLDVESDSLFIPPFSVVTLNYDRSLEYFLARNVEINCPDHLEEHGSQKVQRLRIIHPHGSLGDIATVPYGSVNNNAESVREATRRIKINSDRMEDAEDFQKAQETIADARNIVFLGFGYHERTLSALLDKANLQTKRVFGTAKGIFGERKRKLTLFFRSAIHFGGEGQDCSSFLEHLGIGRNNIQRKKVEQRHSL